MDKTKKINFKEIGIFLLISIIFFGIFVNVEFATDTYSVFSSGARDNAIHFMESGRFVSAFSTAVIRVLNINQITTYILSFIISIICLTICLYEFKKIINKDIKNDLLSSILSILIILNAFIIELFMFIEKGILIFSILMTVLGAKYLIDYLESKNIKKLIPILIFMFIATGSYQGTVGLFIAIAVVYIVKYSKNIKEFILNNVITGICYITPALVDYCIGRAFNGSRISGNIQILESIHKVLSGTIRMLDTYTIIPGYIFQIFLIITLLIIIYKIITNNTKVQTKILNILSVIYIILGTLAAAVLPQLMQNTESIWMVPRSTYVAASLIGILLLYLFINFNDVNKKDIANKNSIINLKNIVVTLSIIYIVIQYTSFTKFEISRYELNYLDKQVSLNIIDNIKEYEQKTGNTITKIAIYQDANPGYSYKNIAVIGDMNVKAYSSDWATKGIIQYYLNRQLLLVDQDPKITEQFKNINWDDFNKSQLIFQNDTLNLCCY